MKNRDGFVVSAVLYPLLVLFLALIMGFLSMNDTRKRILDRMKLEITDSIFDDTTCSCDTILNKLNYLIKHGVGGSGGSSSSFGELNITAYETASDIPVIGVANDIAVITDTEITNYFLTPYEPTMAADGAVWIKIDDDYYALLKGDSSTVPIRVAYQYINGSWVNVQAFVYTQYYGWTALYYSEYYTEYLLNGADPELYDGLVPIQISDAGVITKADVYTEWYSYKDKIWANAVLVTDPSKYDAGDVISESDILMYFVWIPRYKYKLFNTSNGSINPLQIEITFENNKTTKSNGTNNGEWLTHPAFTFGNTELNGMWVAKFETSGSTTALRSKPGVQSLKSLNVYNMFTATRNMELSYASTFNLTPSQIDTHMMKNMEWGAMAYLSHSAYGTCTNGTCTEISINSNSSYYTGGSNSITAWASTYVKQSTTANKYGIYDTSGGSQEYVMGNITTSTTVASSTYFQSSSSGFSSPPADKYIDYYTYDSSYLTHRRGKLGDATKETLATFGSDNGGWYGDRSYFPYSTACWFSRSGNYAAGTTSGIFFFNRMGGGDDVIISFRVVLTAE